MKQLTVITGGAGGMGKAIAKKLGPEYDLVLADRSEEALAKAVEELDALGIKAYTLEAQEEWYDVFDECEAPDFYENLEELVAPFKREQFAYAGTSPSAVPRA